MKCSDPRQVSLNGGVLNSCSQESSEKAQYPFVSWAWRARGMELTKLSVEQNKLCLGQCMRMMRRSGKALGEEEVALLF